MKFEIKPVGSVFGEDDEVVKIDPNLRIMHVETEGIKTFAIVVAMTCESHQNEVKRKLVVPNVESHEDAYVKAKDQHMLIGEWGKQVGITLFRTNKNFYIPRDWENCEVKYVNDQKWDD